MNKSSNIRDMDVESQRVTKVALKVFFNIMHEWKVPEAQQIQLLGRPPSKTFKNWQSSSFLSLNPNTIIRISYIITIYRNLRILLPTREQANDWVHKPNKAFEGESALNVISSGHLNQLLSVINYLNNQLIH